MMRKLLLILTFAVVLVGCKKDETPEPIVAQIISFEVIAQNDGDPEVFTGVIEGENVTVKLPIGYSVKALLPNIETNVGATVYPKSGVVKNFSNPVQYTVTNMDVTTQYTVKITADTVKSNLYKVYQFIATKDVVIGMLDAFASPDSVMHLISEDRSTIDLRYLPKNMLFIEREAPATTDYNQSNLLPIVVDIAKKDTAAKFVFYNGHLQTTDVTLNQVIPQIGFNKCKYVYLEDGSNDYVIQHNYFSNETNKIAFEQSAFLSNLLLKRKLTPAERKQWLTFSPASIQQTFFDKAQGECWFNYPNAFDYVAFPIDAKFKQGYVKKEPLSMFVALSPEKQDQFLKVMKVDKKIFESSKPRLVITGGRQAAEQVRFNKAQMNLVKDVIAKYGQQYTIYFKGHPANTDFEAMLQTEFPNGEIVQIPNSIPFEVLNAAGFGGDKILGIHSTLYFGVPQDRIEAIYFVGTQIDGATYDYIRNMMIPAGAYPSDMTKYKDFYSAFERI